MFLGRKIMTNIDNILKSRDIDLPTKVRILKAMAFFSTHVRMWELDHKEGWTLKNWCFWTVVMEKTLVSPLDCKEIKPVNPKGNQTWIFIGRTDVEAEAPILWPHDAKNRLTGKDPDAGKEWRQEVKVMTEREIEMLLSCERRQHSWPLEERNLIWGQWQGLIAQSFCVIKFK